MIQDCARDGVGFLAGNEYGSAFDALDALDNGTIIQLEPTFRPTLAVSEIEAVLSEAVDWENFNAQYSESTADSAFLRSTDYIGAVDPVLTDDTAPWWSQWTVDCSLHAGRFYDQPEGWDNRWACQDSGIRDQRDRDTDGDGVADAFDQFPDNRGEYVDSDFDGLGNNQDGDDDNDGVADANDAFPIDPTETTDTDGDGVGDNGDVFPDDPTEWLDTDNDGIGDNADLDANGNGFGDCAVGTTEVEPGVCLIPERVEADLTPTRRW